MGLYISVTVCCLGEVAGCTEAVRIVHVSSSENQN